MDLASLHFLVGQTVLAAEGAEQAPMYVQVLTHIVCFLIVFWILKRFAFGPILEVIDERRNRIASDLQQAADSRKQAEADHKALEERLSHIEEEARARMQELIAEGRRVAESIQESARRDAAEMIQKAQKNIEYETEKAREILKKDVIHLTLEATEHLLKEQLDDAKHRQLIGDFLTRLERN